MRQQRNYAPRRAIVPEKPGWQSELYEWLQLLTHVLSFVVIFFTFFGMIFGVSGSSMYPTLHHRDAMLIQRFLYTPAAGDIVVLRRDGFPYEDDTEAIVKRVIATAGQQVHIDYDTNTVYVDGVALEEDYLNFTTSWPDPSTGEMAEHDWLDGDYMEETEEMVYSDFVVPENTIFVMGDNRNGSTDGRDYRLGPVDVRYVVGRAVCIFYPFNRIQLLTD